MGKRSWDSVALQWLLRLEMGESMPGSERREVKASILDQMPDANDSITSC